MNIYRYELKKYVKSIITWSISIFLLVIMFMVFYPSFSGDVAMIDKLLENYPEELLKAFGMGGGLSLATILGYLVFVFAFVQLCLAIQAANYGFSMLSVEERELTADFLMSKPVTRTQIIVSKFLAAFTALTITNLVTWISIFISLELYSDGKAYEVDKIMLVLFSIMVFQLFFLSIGMVISVSVKKIRSVLSFSMALAFGLYVINAMRSIIGGEILGIISPYYHFEPGYILENGHYNLGMVAISVVIIIVSLTASYILYIRRNIHSL